VADLNQPDNHVYLRLDMIGGPRLFVWGQETEFFAILVESVRPAIGDLAQTASLTIGRSDRFVVHIREIANMSGIQAGDLKRAPEDVLVDEGTKITDMRRAIYGWSAAVETENPTVLGMEGFNLATECIV